jgi:hypothetical protein
VVGKFKKKPTLYPLGLLWTNCLKTLKKLSICLLGKYPLAPSERKRRGREENAERTTSDGDEEDEEEESGTVHDSVKHAYTKDGDEGG